MSFLKSLFKDIGNVSGTIAGDYASRAAHEATVEVVNGMNAFTIKADTPLIKNSDYSSGRGFLFEYIEVAKFNREAALKGFTARAFTADALGDPGAAADIIIKENGKTLKEIQAKFNDKASNSVFDQAGGQKGHWGKYHGMDRLIRKDPNYNEQGSMLDEAKKLAKKRANSAGIHAEEYADVYEHLTDETHYGTISSGGTTQEELKQAYEKPKTYAKSFEKRQITADMKITAANMAAGVAVTSGITSGVTNLFSVLNDEKALSEAVIDVSKDIIKGAARGGTTGVISTAIRYEGIKTGNKILSDSSAATILAGGMIDSGTLLWAYAKKEIDGDKLVKGLQETVVKSVSTVYFTKAVEATVGAANPFLPVAIYTVASYVVSTTREIIENAELNAEEYNRLAGIYQASTAMLQAQQKQLLNNISSYRENQQRIMTGFLNAFEYNIQTGENYEHALYAIVNFANQAGIALQHSNFNEFKEAMNSDDIFVLSRNK